MQHLMSRIFCRHFSIIVLYTSAQYHHKVSLYATCADYNVLWKMTIIMYVYIYIYIYVYTYDCCCENPCYHVSVINTFQFYCPMAFISHWYELSSVIIFSCCSNIILQYFSNIMSHMFIHYCFYPCHVEQHRSVIAGYLGIFHLYVVVHPRNRKWFMNPIYIYTQSIYRYVLYVYVYVYIYI